MFCDIVICDYNYVFDPRVKLIRYFEEAIADPKLLIDEAHNMVDRTRQMYSSTIALSELVAFSKTLGRFKASVKNAVANVIATMETLAAEAHPGTNILKTLDVSLLDVLEGLVAELESWLDKNKRHGKRKRVREGMFLMLPFLRVAE